MSWFQSFVLGLVQGLTEFLPISSSGHLRIVAAFSGWDDPGAAFTAITQIGTETAVLIYFRRDIGRILSSWFKSLTDREMRHHPDARMGWLVIVGSIPIGVLGVTLKDTIEGPFRDLRLIATTLIVLGLILGFADWRASRDEKEEAPEVLAYAGGGARRAGRHRAPAQRKSLEQLDVRDGLIFGACQAMALVPGVSRSGATISGGLFLGYTREAAARYSFLLAVPAVLASGAFELTHIADEPNVAWGPIAFATVISFAVGYAVIAWFMRFITTRSFMPFVVYRVLLGLLIFALVGFGVLNPEAGEGVG